jgi:hypothetical protein
MMRGSTFRRNRLANVILPDRQRMTANIAISSMMATRGSTESQHCRPLHRPRYTAVTGSRSCPSSTLI